MMNETIEIFDVFFQQNPAALLICNEQGQILQLNNTASAHFGQSSVPEQICMSEDTSLSMVTDHHGPEERLSMRIKMSDGEIVVGSMSFNAYSDHGTGRFIACLHPCSLSSPVPARQKQDVLTKQYPANGGADVIYDWDITENQLDWSNSLESLLGYPSHDNFFLAKWISKIRLSDRKRFLKQLDEAFSGIELPTEWHQEYEIKNVNNEYVYVADDAMIIRDIDGTPLRIVGTLYNITDRKKAESELKASEKKFSQIFYDSPIIKFIIRQSDHAIIDVNKKAPTYFALDKANLLSLSLQDLLYEESHDMFSDKLSASIDTGQIDLGILNFRKQKRIALLNVTAIPITIDGANCLVLSCVDETEKHTAERSLKIANERYHNAIKATKDVIWDWDVSSDELFIADNYHVLFGHEIRNDSENLGIWRSKVHPEDREIVLKSLAEALSDHNQKRWEMEYRFQKADGAFAFILDKGNIQRDAEGNATRVIGAMEDITERKIKEHELRLINSVVTSANDSVLITAAEPIDEPGPKIIYANEAFYKMTGYSPEDTIGQNPRMLQGPKSDRDALDRLRKAMEHWEPCTIETINYKKSGEEFWVEFSVSPVANEQGLYTHWISIQRDITSRKIKELEQDFFKRLNNELISQVGTTAKLELILAKMAQEVNVCCADMWLNSLDQSFLYKVAEYHEKHTIGDDFLMFKGNVALDEQLKYQMGSDQLKYWKASDTLTSPFTNPEELYQPGSAVTIPIRFNENLIGVINFFDENNLIDRSNDFDFIQTVSQRLGAEIQRIKSEEEIQMLFELGPGPICIATKEGELKKVNQKFCDMMGYSEAELRGMSIFDLAEQNDHTDQEVTSQIKLTNHTGRYQTKSNEFLWLDWSVVEIPGQGFVYCSARDISEKMGLRLLLEQSNALARLGNWEVDLETSEVFWSDVTKEIHGVEPDYVPQFDTAIDFYRDEESKVRLNEYISKAISGEIDSWSMEAQIMRADNRPLWISAMGEVQRRNGHPVKLTGSFQDINERKLIEEELKESNIRYSLATQATTMGIWDWDIVNNDLKWDDGMLRLYGIREDQFTNAFVSWETALHELDRERAIREITEAQSMKKNFESRFRIKTPDGTIKYLQAYAQSITDHSGKVVRMVGLNHDVTEEVHQKMALEEALKEKNDILERLNDGFFAVNSAWTVTYWNKAASSILKTPKENIVGQNLWEVFNDAVKLRFYSEYHDAFESKSPRYFEEYYPAHNMWLSVSVYPNENGLSVFFKDVTVEKMHHEKILEKSIRSMEKERNRIAKELHDGVLQEMVGSMMLAESIKKYFDAGRKEADRVNQLVHYLRKACDDTRRISHDLRSPEIDQAHLITLLNTLIDQLDLLYDAKFSFHCDLDKAAFNPGEIQKINLYRSTQELLTNTIKHSKADNINLHLKKHADGFVIEVEDDGVGMDYAKLNLHSGIGIRNISDRLENLGATLEYSNKENGGLISTIKFK